MRLDHINKHIPNVLVNRFECPTCGSIYLCDVQPSEISPKIFQYSFEYQGYRLVFYRSGDKRYFAIHPSNGYDEILSLEYWPNITPFNAKQKLKTYLTFL